VLLLASKPVELMLMFPHAQFTYVKDFNNYGISLNSDGITFPVTARGGP
jgi:hypothetical protein